MRTRYRNSSSLILCLYGLLSAFIWIIIILLTRGLLGTEGFFHDLPNESMPFGWFFLLYSIAFVIYCISIYKIARLPFDRYSIFVILAGAILFRLILTASVPVHENDFYRYIWDGKVFNSGINPYKHPPVFPVIKPESTDQQDDFNKLRELRDENPAFYRRISYKHIPTIYPPLAQGLFALSDYLARDSVLFIKIVCILFDFAVVLLIYAVLKLLKHNPLYVIVYAWNPLVLKEFANSAHLDSLTICCVSAAVYMYLRKKHILSSLCMSLGVLSKFFPLIFIPFFLFRKQYKAFFFSIAVIIAGYIPFIFWGRTDIKNIFAGLGSYAHKWSYNGFIFELIYSITAVFKNDPYMMSKILCWVIFSVIWFYIFIKTEDLQRKIFLSVSALFLLSPVGDPWYFCWVIPFLCIYPKKSMILLSGLLIMSYFVFTRDFGYLEAGSFKIHNLLLMQYIPFYIVLIYESRAAILRLFSIERKKAEQGSLPA